MNDINLKRMIYRRTFLILFALYFVLMIGFSIFILTQQNKIEGFKFSSFAGHMNNNIGIILQDYMQNEDQMSNISKLKSEFVSESNFYSKIKPGIEFAVYSSNYNLLFNTKDGWICSFSEHSENNTTYEHYGYLSPLDWFSEHETEEIEYYLSTKLQPQKKGDLADYSVIINGLWLNEDMIIPNKIQVTPMYAYKFDEDGNLLTSYHALNEEIIYQSNYENVNNLPYFFSHGSIKNINLIAKNKDDLRNLVLGFPKDSKIFSEKPYIKVNPVTYRYYIAMPYQNSITSTEDNQIYSEFWTTCAYEVNLLNESSTTLLIVWFSTLIPFSLTAWILSNRTYKSVILNSKIN